MSGAGAVAGPLSPSEPPSPSRPPSHVRPPSPTGPLTPLGAVWRRNENRVALQPQIRLPYNLAAFIWTFVQNKYQNVVMII